jgi:hypothetical protein
VACKKAPESAVDYTSGKWPQEPQFCVCPTWSVDINRRLPNLTNDSCDVETL